MNEKSKKEVKEVEIDLDEKHILGKFHNNTEKIPLFYKTGDITLEYEDGTKAIISNGVGQITGSPILKAENAWIEFTWEDILTLALSHPDFEKAVKETATKTTQTQAEVDPDSPEETSGGRSTKRVQEKNKLDSNKGGEE